MYFLVSNYSIPYERKVDCSAEQICHEELTVPMEDRQAARWNLIFLGQGINHKEFGIS